MSWQYVTSEDPPWHQYEDARWVELQRLERHLARLEFDIDESVRERRERESVDTAGGKMEASLRGRQMSQLAQQEEDRLGRERERTLVLLSEQIDKIDGPSGPDTSWLD